MSWRKEQRRAERGYHHGNLKEALLQAALGPVSYTHLTLPTILRV